MSGSCRSKVIAANSTTEFGLRKRQYLFVHRFVCPQTMSENGRDLFQGTSIHVEGFRNVKLVPSEFGSQHLPDRQKRYCSSHHALSPRWEDMAMNH